MTPTLLLDTSVLMAGLRSSLGASYALLGLFGSGRFTVGLTAAMVLENEAQCMESLEAIGLTAEDVADLLNYLCQVARKAAVRFRVRPSLPDPGDELVLEAVLVTESDRIVTHNIRHLAAGAARYGVEAIRPGEALRRLGVQP